MWVYYIIACLLLSIPLSRWYLKRNPTLKIKGIEIMLSALPKGTKKLAIVMIYFMVALLCPLVILEWFYTSIKEWKKGGSR